MRVELRFDDAAAGHRYGTITLTGALGGAGSEPLGDLVLQLQADQAPLRVAGADDAASDIGAFSTLRVGPFSLAP